MNDIKLFFNNSVNEGITPRIENGDFVADDGLETAVIISLFTDRRVTDLELPHGHTSKRGWWGDKFSTDQDKTGSRFWLRAREKRTTQVLRDFEDFAREALEWMKEDGVAKTITATAFYDVNKYLILDIVIFKPDGTNFKYKVNWDKQLISRS